MDRGSLVLTLVALLVVLWPGRAYAQVAVFDAMTNATETADAIEDEDDTSIEETDEDTDDEHADEQDDEALDEFGRGLDEREMAGEKHRKHRAKPVELSRHRTRLAPKSFFLAPMGHGLFCLVDLDEHPGLKDRKWGQTVDVGDCKAVLMTTFGAAFTAGGAIAGLGGGPVLSIVMGAEGAFAGSMFGLGLSYYICRGLPKEIKPLPERHLEPWPPRHNPPLSSVIPSPGALTGGVPCLCPDPGCGCDCGCGCGCGDGASCGCGACGGGA